MNDLGHRRPIVDRSTLQPPSMRRDCPEFIPPVSGCCAIRVSSRRVGVLGQIRDNLARSRVVSGGPPKREIPIKTGQIAPSCLRRSEKKRLLTGGLLVRVQPEEPISTFASVREHVERLNVSRRKSSAIESGVRYDCFYEARLFARIFRNIRRIGTLREF